MLQSWRRMPALGATCALALVASLPCHAGPVSIEYELASLAGPARFEYRYRVTNVSLATPVSWFSIDFDTALFDETSLVIASVGLADWSETVLGSVPVFGVPAQYDAYKTIGAGLGIGSSEVGFAVQFTWLGAGLPGAQAFTVYDPDNLNVIDSGLTAVPGDPPPPGVPEPSTPALVLLSLCGMLAAGRRAAASPGHTPGA
jgi:hypothetical protein